MSFSLTPRFVGGVSSGVQAAGQAANIQTQQLQQQQLQQQAALAPQVAALRTRALTDPQALQQLAALSPEAAQEIQTFQQGEQKLMQQRFETLDAADQRRIRSVTQGALQISSIPSVEGKIAALEQRKIDNARAGVDSRETDEVLELFKAGRVDEANNLINSVVQVGTQLGVVKEPAKPTIKEGVGPDGQPAFFSVTPEGAQVIPGAQPAPKAPLVSIGGEVSESKKLGELRVKRFDELQQRADAAREQLVSLEVLDAVDLKTGASEPFKQALGSIAEGFGIDASSIVNVAAGEVFSAAAGTLVLGVLSKQKGPQTDADRAFIAKTMTSLGNRPESNEFIQNTAVGVLEKTIAQEAFQENWLRENDTLAGAREAWNLMRRDVPFVSRHVKSPAGLPIFFYQFRRAVAGANPNASEADIREAWKNQEIAAKETAREARKKTGGSAK